ncbi:Hint domain-containing protein [Roseovarius sp.]|uniref:Hint domain-containing protein n=1 Tax=Roseovarius sp. TaxID=1486281 RepID=UPI000C5F35E5|nr:Hint domain-containing protein [Roseovarius sp.]MAZ22512.1 type I secretion protein [Roseovarius sp.]
MPYLYVYSPDDFVEGLPDEESAAAAGSPDFTLTLKPGATPTLIEVADDDAIIDEVEDAQTLTNAVNLDGTTYAAGTEIHSAYDLINSTTGHKVTSLHFGGDGFQQGVVQGLISTVELTPGSSYTFNQERTSHQQNNQYAEYVACFTPGALIDTPDGPRGIETLSPGDLVTTRDAGPQRLRMIPTRHLSPETLAVRPNLRPIRIAADSLGPGLPAQDLLVSPQHRILANSPIVRRIFGCDEVLIAATALTRLPGVDVDSSGGPVTYMHLIFDSHQLVTANGLPSESFYCGPFAIKAMPPAARQELFDLFPELGLAASPPEPARPIVTGPERHALLCRQIKNDRALLEPERL